MSGSIQGTGSQQPVDYSSPSVGQGAETSKAVGSGMISNNAKLQMMQGEKAVTRSQLEHRPTLLKPENMSVKAQAAAANAASEDLTGLGKTTRAATNEVGNAMMRIQLGIQKMPEDQQWLLRNAASFDGAAKYLKSLQNGEDKQLLLGGQGFDEQQIEDLMLSKNDQTALTNKLKAKYGDAFSQEKADLMAMGYDDHQADMILSLGDDNLLRSDLRKAELKKIFKDSPEGQKLAELGFGEKKIKELLALINKGGKPSDSLVENQKLQDLMGKMGFTEKEASVLLATGNKDKLKNQLMLMKQLESNPEMIEKLETWAKESRALAEFPKKPFVEEHLKQLADIFMVLELIHQMSVEQRRYAREARSAEWDAAKAEVLKQADHIREAAKFTLIADIAQGGMSLMGGMMSMRAGMKGGMKAGPKGAKGKTSADDVQVSSPGGGKKSGKGAKGKKAKGTARQDGVEQNNSARQQNKANQKKNMEKDAQKAEQKRADREAETQQQGATQRQRNKEAVTKEQDKDAVSKQDTAKKSSKSQENSNEMMANSNKGMMFTHVTGAVGTLAAAPFKFMASEQQALQKESEARQKTHENAAQAWSEWMQLQQDQVKNCQSKIDEINRIHFDTLKSLSRG